MVVCGALFDMRDLAQMLAHVHDAAMEVGSRGVSFSLGRIAPRAGLAGAAAGAGVLAFPGPLRMIFADSAAVLATGAFHAPNLSISLC
jgi:hypothetical protein